MSNEFSVKQKRAAWLQAYGFALNSADAAGDWKRKGKGVREWAVNCANTAVEELRKIR